MLGMCALSAYIGNKAKRGVEVRPHPTYSVKLQESRAPVNAALLRYRPVVTHLSATAAASAQTLHATRVLRVFTCSLVTVFYVSCLNIFMLALYCNVRASTALRAT